MGITLVTGASGFVGAHLMDEMRRRNLPARGVTRGTVSGLTHIPSYGPEMDWANCLEGVDTVTHLAARVHVMRETASDPISLFRDANVASTINLARQAAQASVRRFVFVSSIKVNGERTEPGRPFTADDPPNPQDPYGISKAEAEAALTALGRETGMEITIIRPALVYGPGVGGNFRTLMKWVSRGGPSFFRSVKNKRSLLSVHVLTRVIIAALARSSASNRCFLASDPRPVSTHEILTAIAEGYGTTLRDIYVPEHLIKLAGIIARPKLAQRILENLEVDAKETYQALNLDIPGDTLNSIRDLISCELASIRHP